MFRITLLVAVLCLAVQAQEPAVKAVPIESKGIPPRAAPTDYQAHEQVGKLTIAAEFAGHAVPTEQGPLSNEDYVSVEVGLFGGPGARASISPDDFSVRINGKKQPIPARQFSFMFESLKDPEWQPPETDAPKSKGGLSSGGQGGADTEPPRPVKMPFALQRAINQRVQRAALPEGDRALPVAGLLFFQYRGQAKSIRTVQLIYNGSAGKTALDLNP